MYSNKRAPFVKYTFPFLVAIYISYKSNPLYSLFSEDILEYKRTEPFCFLDISVAFPTPVGTLSDLTTLIVEICAAIILEFKNLEPTSKKHCSPSSGKAALTHSLPL